MAGSHLSAIPIADVFSTGGFTVNPGNKFVALNVPEKRLFVLTDVIVFPVIKKSDPDFTIQYSVEEHVPGSPNVGVGVRFQYMTVGTGENWSQHFTGGIKFFGGKDVVVVSTNNSKGQVGFQLLGYFTNP
jgi:hypothetical protein